MKKTIFIILFTLTLFMVSACNSSNQDTTNNPASTEIANQLTQIAVKPVSTNTEAPATQTSTPAPLPTATIKFFPTATLLSPPISSTIIEGKTTNQNPSCLTLEVIAETVPDGTVLIPGDKFEKIWTLKNAGSCTWEKGTALVFDYGTDFLATSGLLLSHEVSPGETYEATIMMTAPTSPGTHTGFWKLETKDGVQFGWGSTGSNPFWIKINIPGPTPTSQQRYAYYASGGSLRYDGKLVQGIRVGDSHTNQAWQAFVQYDYGVIPPHAVITSVTLDLIQNTGDPFEKLGCLSIYIDNFGTLDASDFRTESTGTRLWTFCSKDEITTKLIHGTEPVIEAFQDGVLNGTIQMRFEFSKETDGNGINDYLELKPAFDIRYYKAE